MFIDRTAHILETALWRFSLQALHLTTTAEIARHADVSNGTLFRLFPTKEDLLDNVYAYAMASCSSLCWRAPAPRSAAST